MLEFYKSKVCFTRDRGMRDEWSKSLLDQEALVTAWSAEQSPGNLTHEHQVRSFQPLKYTKNTFALINLSFIPK